MHRHLALTLSTLLLFCAATGFASAPAVFHRGDFDSAVRLAARNEKLLVIDFMATWCGPCKTMDRETWSKRDVALWCRDNAVVVQVDVDREKDISRKFNIRAMPTVVVLRGDTELGRYAGGQSPARLVSWIASLRDGVSRDAVYTTLFENQEVEGDLLMDVRRELARAEYNNKNYAASAEHYAWFWTQLLDKNPRLRNEDTTNLMNGTKNVLRRAREARAIFEPVRRTLREGVDAGHGFRVIKNWATLSVAMGHAPEVLTWYEANKGKVIGADSILEIVEADPNALALTGRWAEYGQAIENPVERFKRFADEYDAAASRRDMQKQMEILQTVLSSVDKFHTGLLAAGREDEAFQLAEVLSRFSPKPAVYMELLVNHALNAGFPHETHAEWMEQNGKPELAQKVREALGLQTTLVEP